MKTFLLYILVGAIGLAAMIYIPLLEMKIKHARENAKKDKVRQHIKYISIESERTIIDMLNKNDDRYSISEEEYEVAIFIIKKYKDNMKTFLANDNYNYNEFMQKLSDEDYFYNSFSNMLLSGNSFINELYPEVKIDHIVDLDAYRNGLKNDALEYTDAGVTFFKLSYLSLKYCIEHNLSVAKPILLEIEQKIITRKSVEYKW